MALKKGAIDNFFKISQKYATAKQNSSFVLLGEEESINLTQTLHKPNTNIAQNTPKPHSNQTQISHTLHQISTQTQYKSSTETDTNLTQILHTTNSSTKQEFSFSTLVGNFKKIVLYIYNLCKFNGSYEIILSINNVAASTQIPIGSVNTTLVRLERMEYIQKTQSRSGRGGWKKIKINEKIYKEILLIETLHKPYTEPYTEHSTMFLSSGSNNIYYNKTTTDSNVTQSNVQLTIEWQSIDIEPLRKVGFFENHLKQLALLPTLSPEIVQNSIYAFAFDLEKNGKRKIINGDPINYFIGILRNKGSYLPPSNYESPQDLNRRLYIEKMREIEVKRAKDEEEAFNFAFNGWFSNITDMEKIEFAPKSLRHSIKADSHLAEGGARNHFKKEIWPDIKNKIESGNEDL
ncbi:conserved hypothetical protein [Gammaproteobacteria bacterium]